MPEKMIQDYKRKVQIQVRIMFGILVLGLVLGLYGVQEFAKDYATDKVLKVQAAQRKSDRLDAKIQKWNTNHTACGIRQLINIKSLQKTLDQAKEAAVDKTVPKSQRDRAKESVKRIEGQIDNSKKVIALFGTIPPGFNCKTLSKLPPTK